MCVCVCVCVCDFYSSVLGPGDREKAEYNNVTPGKILLSPGELVD